MTSKITVLVRLKARMRAGSELWCVSVFPLRLCLSVSNIRRVDPGLHQALCVFYHIKAMYALQSTGLQKMWPSTVGLGSWIHRKTVSLVPKLTCGDNPEQHHNTDTPKTLIYSTNI